METSLFKDIPTILVQNNRGRAVRQIQYNTLGFLAHSIDPRLYEQSQTDDTIKANFSYQLHAVYYRMIWLLTGSEKMSPAGMLGYRRLSLLTTIPLMPPVRY
ncbi:MAG: hypothetical protein AB8W37_11785 [Arsenophonus endosymbiont of Dermacentor nuttalli]